MCADAAVLFPASESNGRKEYGGGAGQGWAGLAGLAGSDR
jgi:hypothetical protein